MTIIAIKEKCCKVVLTALAANTAVYQLQILPL